VRRCARVALIARLHSFPFDEPHNAGTTMTKTRLLASAALAASTLMLGNQITHAEGWRCMDRPSESECQDDLINDIEDTVAAEWRSPFTLAMTPLPYSCTRTGGGNPAAPDDERADLAVGPTMSLRGNFAWSFTFTTGLRSFLVGQDTAAADLAGSVTATGPQVTPVSWNGMGINLVFGESSTEVMAPEGPTGVAELGGVTHATRDGDFWSTNRSVRFTWTPTREGDYACVVGSPVVARGTGRNRVVIDVPITRDWFQEALAELVREEFRRAVRLLVTGTP
jgi:hypothetical protein